MNRSSNITSLKNPPVDISGVGWTLADISRLLRKLVDKRLSGVGITRAQWQALGNLKRLGPMTQAALADVMEVETATITRLIDRLEAAGWVIRKPHSTDRRVKLVHMSEKADAVIEEVASIGHQLREDMLIDLPEAERAHFITLLSTVKSRLVHLLETP
jgi:DNA-binding MarR family transcriptional regulator